MSERLAPPLTRKDLVSRRAFLIGTGAVVLGETIEVLHKGITLAPPAHEVYAVTIGEPDKPLTKPNSQVSFIKKSPEDSEYFTREGQIIISNNDHTFSKGEKIPTLHRSGDKPNLLQEDVQKKIPGADIDASVVLGKVYVEHGSIFRIKVGPFHVVFPLIVDGDEKRIELRFPTSFEQRIKEIAAYNREIDNSNDQIKAMIEAKNGKFTDRILTEMSKTLEANDVAGVIFGGSIEKRVIGKIAA